MKSLKESILDVDDNIESQQSAEDIIRRWVDDNCFVTGNYTVEGKVINVQGNMYIKSDFDTLPYKFGIVNGDFNIRSKNVESMVNFPDKVMGDFICGKQPKLKSLEGMPLIIGGDCYLSNCVNLQNLKGICQRIVGDLNLDYCHNLRNIEDLGTIGGSLNLHACIALTSLKGCPKTIKKSFICSGCEYLDDLTGGPSSVYDCYYCNNCTGLTSLDGIAKRIGKVLELSNCPRIRDIKALYKTRVMRIMTDKSNNADFSKVKTIVMYE